MYRIVASDLDGTLLTPDHSIAPYTRDVLQRLHQKGEHFVFATGRHHIDVAHIRQSVGIPAFMITSNGARVHDADDNLVFSRNVEPEVITELVNMMKDDETVTIHIYRENDWLLNRVDEDLAKYHKDSGFSFTLFDPENPPLEDVAKIFFIRHDHDYLTAYEKKFIDTFGDKVSVAFSTPFCLEVMAAGVSKGEALKAVAEIKGFSLDECIAFGDGMNDVEMLSAAKKGLVMETAHPRVKATLPNNEVIGSHADEAVARYLETHLL
ncbi:MULTISPECIES: Cof-type HAD-IIB family hydrolase [Enterovibrio]|uniref:Sugar/pyridoxal phosphate phosphatase YigL n=1 Tax=Enterovibrio norvegicus FF-454 TaxID=1185651 RepID=A0A1E5CDR8_9GAMM|nr:Cof-type HAD-IIB family hydrolase [Enterovibrio norvegicus]OEE63658.1 sugar/pyridoxal phosphate phosphatase YigL [Enterovibrio norvegicus FF-454]OEE84269.1 sugar/pyridoxal phosphate phosphatase YigL [Enterovibrio norvegicus FF-162]